MKRNNKMIYVLSLLNIVINAPLLIYGLINEVGIGYEDYLEDAFPPLSIFSMYDYQLIYILFPNAKDEYNSNSYAKGLLNAAGINDLGGPEMFQVLVGGSDPYMANTAIPEYEYPVPEKYFGLS